MRLRDVQDLNASVLLLPTQTRGDATYYQADDVEALKIARHVGLDAAYLVSSNERRYLNEFASGWALELAIGFAANIAAAGVEAIIAYVLGRARRAVELGRHDGPEHDVPIKLQIGKLTRSPSGELSIENLLLEGSTGDAVVEVTRLILGQQNVGAVGPISPNPTRETA